MEQRKKRILMCNEASFLNTGYSTYGYEVLRRLHDTGKYDIAEFATYGHAGDPRARQLPWAWFPNMPDGNNDDQIKEYESKTTNQFGEWRFEETCLKFQPDIVFDIRDHWMFQYQIYSAFRPYYWHVIMPTVDAMPQENIWINDFMQADKVLTYTDFGMKTLNDQAANQMKLFKTASPGADLDTLKPIANKSELKKSMGLPEDTLIIGTVMRNQKRKLYPDLFLAFAEFLKQAPPELARRAILYCHTSYPDVGWDLPLLLKESGISHKVFFTYICKQCGAVTAMKYTDINAPCRRCSQPKCGFPNPQFGVTKETLGRIYNLFDIYVQYAICEGAGMPQIEAASCGVPIMAVDYSGMEDIVRKLNGTPIKVQRFYREAETHRIMAMPDNQDLINSLISFLSLPTPVRARKGKEARELCEKYYNWDGVAKIWEEAFDSLPIRPIEETWKSPARIFNPEPFDQATNNMSNEGFVKWAIIHLAKEPRLLNTYVEQKFIRDLNFGQTYDYMGVPYFSDLSSLGIRPKLRPFTRQDFLVELDRLVNMRNVWEQRRKEAIK